MKALRAAALALQFGFVVGGLISAGLFGGRWLDQRLETEPLFVLAGLLLGLASSAYVFYMITALLRSRKG